MRLAVSAARFAAAAALCGMLRLAAAHAAAGPQPQLPDPFYPAAMDRSANACTNFFGYATGTYTATHPIPPAYTSYGYYAQLEDRTRAIVRDIVAAAQRDPGAAGGNPQKIGDFYASCMDTATIERRGLTALEPALTAIAATAHASELPVRLAQLHAIGVDAGFAFSSTQDIRDTARIIGEFDQGGLGLPERDYYLRTDADSRKLRTQYTAHVVAMLRLAGDRDAAAEAPAVVALETRFARASLPEADMREPLATYHPMPASDAYALAPHAALGAYVAALGVAPDRVNVAEPDFLRAFDAALTGTPLGTWKSYLRWRLIDTFASALPQRFESEEFAFRDRILNGVTTEGPRWKRCVNATSAALGEAIGQAYVARTFGPHARAQALAMTLRIKRAYRAEMSALTWMTAPTKTTAIAKLDALGLKIGYPTVWRSYAGFHVRPGDYAANVEAGFAFEHRYELAKIGRPVDRNEWFITPQTVDAYNDPNRNEIVMPAAALQRPFFAPGADDAANLGSIGAGWIGHEMTHGFDDEGHKFDAQGNLRNWWTGRDSAQFDRRAQCVIDQFDRTAAVGSLHYQGRLVAGEAIADLGGVVIGYRALETAFAGAPHAAVGGFTPEQRFFLAYAQQWTEIVRPQAARTQALTDPHPLPRDRVNVTLANVPEWYRAFDCPKPRRPVCRIW